MMTQYRYEYGKRWNAKVPRGAITWLMNRTHVSKSNAEIERDIRSRCKDAQYTESLIKQSVAYALEIHKRNQELYKKVMKGLVG